MVIQIPNPLLLPQSYGMGEVAGMGFGSNYVMLMQIVYNYYAPRVVKEMEDGNLDHPMDTVWWNKWQRFMTKYSDQSIQNTMDRVLDIPDKVLDSIWGKLGQFLTGNQGDENFTQTNYDQDSSIFGVRYDGGGTAQRHEQQRDAPNNRTITSGKYQGYTNNQLNKPDSSGMTLRQHIDNQEAIKKFQEQARQRTASEAITKTAETALRQEVQRTGVVTSIRKAGQSQI